MVTVADIEAGVAIAEAIVSAIVKVAPAIEPSPGSFRDRTPRISRWMR
jgi:hypothetical protein